MASNRVYTESVVTLNNQEATARIDELREKATNLRLTMAQLAQEKGINSKEFAKARKELISLEESMKSINEKTKDFEKIINNVNGASLNELQKAARTLNQQMRRLKPGTEEFVAASKKLKEVRTRMKEIEDQSRVTQNVFAGFFKKIGWASIITGAVSLFKKMASDMVTQTQLVGDKWRAETKGWKDAYNVFIAELASGKGWNEMISNMRNAYKVGKEVSAMLDELFERQNSLSLKEAEYKLEIEKQKQVMMDATRTNQERLAAADEITKKERELADERKSIARQELDARQKEIQARTNLSEAELDAFIRDYNQNQDLIKQAQEYTEELQRREKAVQGWKASMNMGDIDGAAADILESNLAAAEESLAVFKAQADESVVYWAETVAKYNLGNDEMVQNYVNARRKMTEAETSFYQNTSRTARTSATLRKQLATEAQNAVNKAYENEIKKSDERYKSLQLQAKQAYADGEISESEYQSRITALQESSLKDRIAISERFKQSSVEFQSQLLDLSIAEKRKLEKLMADMEAEAEKALKEYLDTVDKEISAEMEKLDDEMQDFIDRWMELSEKANEIRREMNPVTALREDMESELTTLQELLDSNLLSEDDYQKKRLEIIRRYQKEILEAQMEPYKAGVENAQKYLEQTGQFMESLQSAASARLDAQMQAELTAAGDNAEKREEIEANYEQKKLDLQKRYANINMGIEIAKTVAAGALSVMKGYSELGPVGGAVFAALIAATTAAQVATIVAQRNAIMNTTLAGSSSGSEVGQRVATGYSSGGYTDKSPNDYQEVGVVHANEWVAPAAMVRANPVVFASLESARRSGNYHSGIPGFADGGSTSPDVAAAAVPSADSALLQKTFDLMRELKESLPWPTYVLLTDINAKQDLENLIKSIVGK